MADKQVYLLDENEIEKENNKFSHDNKYEEETLLMDIFRKYPLNDNIETVAMKIAVLDMVNSTNFVRYKKKISLREMATYICNITDFDERVKNGDPTLVNELAKTNGNINLFSFASKYCTYHNVAVYKNDDYSIYDGIVAKHLPKYSENLTKSRIEQWRNNLDYSSFVNCITEILDKNNIHIDFRRRKFDYYLWYTYRNVK